MMPEATGRPHVARRSMIMLEVQLRSRLWLDSPALSLAEKRRLIVVCRNGIHTLELQELDTMIAKLKNHVGLRTEEQRQQYPTRFTGAGYISWDHYHWTDLMRDIDKWEADNPLPITEPVLKIVEEPKATSIVVHQMPMQPEAANVFAVLRDYGAPMKSADIAEFLDSTQNFVSGVLCSLKLVNMVEQVPHTRLWRVTDTSHGYTVVVSE